MTFENPEVVDLGPAEDSIQDEISQDTTEGMMPSRIKLSAATYIAEAE